MYWAPLDLGLGFGCWDLGVGLKDKETKGDTPTLTLPPQGGGISSDVLPPQGGGSSEGVLPRQGGGTSDVLAPQGGGTSEGGYSPSPLPSPVEGEGIEGGDKVQGTQFVSVRFGNVLGSRGSVLPLFLDQLKHGGPLTVTHKEMRRYFMTIPEAVSLVLQASIMGNGGEVFVLDMGEPVKIVDIAEELIRIHSLEPYKDIDMFYAPKTSFYVLSVYRLSDLLFILRLQGD